MRPTGAHWLYLHPRVAAFATRHFHRVYYYWAHQTVLNTRWLGVRTVKYPTDLWIYQELLGALRPTLIVETGTLDGGSALYFASLLELLGGEGRVLSVDIRHSDNLAEHERVEYITGSSVAPETVEHVRQVAHGAERVVVVLDSNHACDHVLAELRLYADLVTPGSYLIVEDTNLNGRPVLPGFGVGPGEAVDRFLAERRDFAPDPECERFLLTANPRGFLRRSGQPSR
jgi:cephalosporin hydroxylase